MTHRKHDCPHQTAIRMATRHACASSQGCFRASLGFMQTLADDFHASKQISSFHYPDAWADPKSRVTMGFCHLHYRSTGVQNWGIYLLDPPGGLDRDLQKNDAPEAHKAPTSLRLFSAWRKQASDNPGPT